MWPGRTLVQAGPGRPAWWALSLWPPLAEGKRAENGRGAGAPVNYRVLCPPGLCPFLVMVPDWHRGPGSGRLRQGQGPGVALTQAPPFHPEVTVPHLPSGLLLEVNRADTCPSSPRTSRARPCLSRDPEPWAQRSTDPHPQLSLSSSPRLGPTQRGHGPDTSRGNTS